MIQSAPTSSHNPVQRTPTLRPEGRAQLIVELTQLALSAPDIPSAVMPALQTLVDFTAAAGSEFVLSKLPAASHP